MSDQGSSATIPSLVQKSFPRPIKRTFGSYVTRNLEFASHLRGVRNKISTYVNKISVKRPLNILLAAPPGSGKSFLIKQMIKTIESPVDLAFEEVYIGAFDSSHDLYSIFQRVQSLNLEGKVPVVFFDEIDAEVSGGHLYAKFLSPMWDGTFYIGKERFFLGRSIFFFAGSNLSLEDASQTIINEHQIETEGAPSITYKEYLAEWEKQFRKFVNEKSEIKLPDFVDRLDAIVRIPPIKEQLLGSDLRSEYEDLAFMLVAKHYPQAKYVGKRALDVICRALMGNRSVRPAEKIIFNSTVGDKEVFDLSWLPPEFRPATNSAEDCKEVELWQPIIEDADTDE